MVIDLGEATRLAGNDGRFSATLTDQWEIWGPNGGYLAAIALRAAGEVAEVPRPRSFYCHFLSSPAFADVDIEVSLLKRGSRAESLSVAMSQSGKPILQALVKTATDGPGYAHQHPSMPDVPPAEEVEAYEYVPAPGRPAFRFWENVERRPIVAASEERSPVLREWTRFRHRVLRRPVPRRRALADPARHLRLPRRLPALPLVGLPRAQSRHEPMVASVQPVV